MSVAAALLLAYTGDEPVNVGWFFACTVGIQWLILLASLLIWLLRRTTHLFENFRPLRNLLGGLIWSLSAALQQLPGEQRQRDARTADGDSSQRRSFSAACLASSHDHSDFRGIL